MVKLSSMPLSATSVASVSELPHRYVKPRTPVAVRMRNRVSSRLREAATPLVSSSSKCLIQTVPVGNDQLADGSKPIVRLMFGTENQRVLIALSDQNGTLSSYGTMPGLTVSDARFANAPVAASVAGRVLLVTA